MSLKATVSMDGNGGTPKPTHAASGPSGTASIISDPTLPVYLPWDAEKGTYQFLTTFCLGCKEKGMTITRTVHGKECLGAVVIVGCEYVPAPGGAVEREAHEAVEAELKKLETDEAYLEEQRGRYKAFMSGWTNKNRKAS